MIVCKSCGFRNADDDQFCGTCGKFLEWTGEKVVPLATPAPSAAPTPEPESKKRSFLDKVSGLLYLDVGERPAEESGPTGGGPPGSPGGGPPMSSGPPGPPRPPGPPTGPPTAPPSGPPTGPPPPPSSPPPGPPPTGPPPPPSSPPTGPPPSGPPSGPPPTGPPTGPPPPSGPPTAPPSSPPPPPAAQPSPVVQQSAGDQFGAIKPQAAAPKPKVTNKVESKRQLLPGDLVCGQCGKGNPPTRKFCHSCGASLAAAEVVKTSWWRKLFLRRKPKVLAAGERPKGISRSDQHNGQRRPRRGLGVKTALLIKRILPIGIVVLGLLYGLDPSLRANLNSKVNSLENKIRPQYVQVRPVSIRASSQIPDHPGTAAADGFTNTYWQANTSDGQPTLLLTFQSPVKIDKIIVHNGNPDAYQTTNRPQQLHFVFSGAKSTDVTLQDDGGSHTYAASSGGAVDSVEIHVTQQYRSFTPSAMALAEVEFYYRKL